MALLIDGFVKSFLTLDIDLAALRRHISKPLRPLWITPETQFEKGALIFEEYHTILCCTASRRVSGGEASEGGYIQGSGDDTENWAHGLTPPVFWANEQLLLSTDEVELPSIISDLVAASTVAPETAMLRPVAPTSSLYITTLSTILSQPPELRSIMISLTPKVTDQTTWQISPTELSVGLGPHKLGSRSLRTALPHIVSFVSAAIVKGEWKGNSSTSITVSCPTGKDHSVGVALALLCLIYDDKGNIRDADNGQREQSLEKTFIRRRLGWVMTSMPDANPSRATLQSVNSFLMERPE
jgi:tRNA A64-2'-O-ribosylphosphate transferase